MPLDLCVRPYGCTHKKRVPGETRLSGDPLLHGRAIPQFFGCTHYSAPKTGYVSTNFPIPQLLLGSTEAMDPAKALSGMV